MKVITVLEQEFEKDGENLKLISQKILKTEVLNDRKIEEKTLILTETDARYGIIGLGKKHELASLYSPETEIIISINGILGKGRWHKTQVRISALTQLFRHANVKPETEYRYNYDIKERILYLEMLES